MSNTETRTTHDAGTRTPGTRLPLLARMQRDLRDQASLQPGTVGAMYLTYGAHAAITAVALRQRWLPLPLPRRATRFAGWSLAAVGAGLCIVGMRMFAGPGQVSGTQAGHLVTGGVYRYSRNPQYLGYVLALMGAATARRGGAGLVLAGAAGATYAAWVPVEEEHLTTTLGGAYDHYRRETARWLGRSRGGRAH